MSINSLTNRNDYIGTGILATYSYSFRIFDETHLLVTKRTDDGTVTTLVLNTDYTVTGVEDAPGGTIILTDALEVDAELAIRRVLPLTQPTDIRNQGFFFPETHENAFDRSVMMNQQQQDELNRSLKSPENETAIGELPSVTERAGRFLAFDADGEPVASGGNLSSSIVVTPFMETLLDDVSAAAARSTLEISVADGVTIQDVAEVLSVKDGGIGTLQLATEAVTTPKIGPQAVGEDQMANGSVSQFKIADAAVISQKLADDIAIKNLNAQLSLSFAGFNTLKILQIVQYTTAQKTAVTAATYQPTLLTGSITPKISTSKILVIAAGNFALSGAGIGYLTVFRDSTDLANTDGGFALNAAGNNFVNVMKYDSPGTVAAVTYEVRIRHNTGSGGTAAFPETDGGIYTPTANMILVEIAQ